MSTDKPTVEARSFFISPVSRFRTYPGEYESNAEFIMVNRNDVNHFSIFYSVKFSN